MHMDANLSDSPLLFYTKTQRKEGYPAGLMDESRHGKYPTVAMMRIGYDILFSGEHLTGFFGNTHTPVQTIREGGLAVSLISDCDSATGVTRRRLQVENTGGTGILHHADICYALDFPHAHLSYFTSDWGSEYTPCEVDVTYPVRIGTWSGRSAKGCSPYFTVCPVGREHSFFGVSIGWSGNWEAAVKRHDGGNLVTAGLLKDDFFKQLGENEVFENIEIFDSFHTQSQELLAASFRTYFRDNISLMKTVFKSLPVAFNSWWPYEDKWIGEEVFYQNAVEAKKLGCTNTLMDAGWFGPPGDPNEPGASQWHDKQGDWDLVNTAFFPSGIAALGKKVNEEARIPFGIWCEIEAVGKDSRLYETHPQLIAMKNGKALNYVCMGNPETQKWAFDTVKTLVEEYGAKWIKIDFNLDPVSCDCEAHGHGKGDGLYAHYKGLYSFMDTIRAAYPELVIENCSSGGLRIDYGIMQHCHIAFLSDPDYTPHHLKCYWGMLSHIHPCGCYHFTKSETVCEHNYAWDENGERWSEMKPVTPETSLARFDYMTRAAMMSGFALSHKLTELPEWAKTRYRQCIKIFHEISDDFLYNGDVYRLTPQPGAQLREGGRWSGFSFLSQKKEALLFVFKKPGGEFKTVFKIPSLQADALYCIEPYEGGEKVYSTGYRLEKDGHFVSAESEEWSEIYKIIRVQ